jgi:hypothetical protein
MARGGRFLPCIGTALAVLFLTVPATAASAEAGPAARIRAGAEPGTEYDGPLICRIGEIFQASWEKTLRFSSVELSCGSGEEFFSDSAAAEGVWVMDVRAAAPEYEELESGRQLFRTRITLEVAASEEDEPCCRHTLALLGIGASRDQAVNDALSNLRFGVFSLIRELPLPGPLPAVSYLIGRTPWVVLPADSEAAVGDLFVLYSASGRETGAAVVTGLTELEQSGGKDQAAELRMLYADSEVVPGMGLVQLPRPRMQVSLSISSGLSVLAVEAGLRGFRAEGLHIRGSGGFSSVFRDRSADFQAVQPAAGSYLLYAGLGAGYRLPAGRKTAALSLKVVDRLAADVGTQLFLALLSSADEQESPFTGGIGTRLDAGFLWYLSSSVELSLTGTSLLVRELSQNSSPYLQTFMLSAGAALRL